MRYIYLLCLVLLSCGPVLPECPEDTPEATPDVTPTPTPEPYIQRSVSVSVSPSGNLTVEGDASLVRDVDADLCLWVGDFEILYCGYSCDLGMPADPVVGEWYSFSVMDGWATLCDWSSVVLTFCAIGPEWDTCTL